MSAGKSLAGKNAVVAGASRGIGAAIARALAAEGANVAINYASSDAAAGAVVADMERQGVKAAAFKADQADPRQVHAMVAKVAEMFGALDIVVNAAGISGYALVGEPMAPLDAYGSASRSDEHLDDPVARYAGNDRLWQTNVFGLAALVRAAVGRMNDNGRIIAVGSMGGRRVRLPGVSDYCATKAAVAHYCRGWARDLGPRGITVNTVEPGPIDTDLHRDDDSALAATVRATTALGRFGKPGEVADLVTFLAGPKAAYISGAIIAIDGGANA